MGLTHPNPRVPEMRMSIAARKLAADLGLTGQHVFFNSGWVPYDQRANVLLDADVGVSTHLDHAETAYSFRTRLLDYLWAGLPHGGHPRRRAGRPAGARGAGADRAAR